MIPRQARLDAGTLHHVIVARDRYKSITCKICKDEDVSIEELRAGSRRKGAIGARARIAIGLVKTHGVALAEVARQLGISTSAISKIIKRASQ
jgi:DNA-directed RNA polymerase specialized sigma subunit